METEFWRRSFGDGVLETEFWRRSFGDGVLETEFWRRSFGDGVLETEFWCCKSRFATLSTIYVEFFTTDVQHIFKVHV